MAGPQHLNEEIPLRRALTMTVVATTLTLGLAACGSDSDTGSGSSGTGKGGGALKVGMAYDVGGRGDQSFNDSAAKGLDKAKSELGVSAKESEANTGEAESAREQRLQTLVDGGYTTVVAVGFAYAKAVGKVAKENPDVKFAIIDDASDDSKGDNVEQITFSENEGSYLIGAAAALKTKTNHIGFVGGVQTPLIKKFEAGYIAGAKKVKPSIKIDSTYLTQPPDFTGFADPAKGKTAADGQFQAGADIVYHAAGGSGAGVFNAAKAAGANKWAIGVDSDQALTADPAVRSLILTSMVKNVNVGVYDFIKSVKDGSFKAGNKVFDLKSGGVSVATTGGHIDDIKTKLDPLREQIISGSIKVPTTP
ncbi:BMP family ABC transporter substrate-binding protein [Luteipulveratus sp. YIM 133132]|uniref:BMP family lipoprotein n=1 Tax=Luteipulveratus flavus TaxID=3031728 RepID=UPI0023AFA098|nr:BMP family ABC transporter substrate-binding protein [Luteipulveratus sp. YIM 133132]MDE9367090.1 BMP family ABC transporter substrate-binding protein [Luteipulveratus sp. YIM 133132]